MKRVYYAPSDAGWSSLVARRAHNPKAVGSNPAPATKLQSIEISVLFSFLNKGKFNRNKGTMSGNIMPLSINLIRFGILSYRQYQSVMAFAIFEPQESIIIRRQSMIKFEQSPPLQIPKQTKERRQMQVVNLIAVL